MDPDDDTTWFSVQTVVFGDSTDPWGTLYSVRTVDHRRTQSDTLS